MEAILAFDTKSCISKKGAIQSSIKENLQIFYNKTKCNTVIMTRAKSDISCNKNTIKNRLYIVLTREPQNYKEIANTCKKNILKNDDNINENILLFPKNYSTMYSVLQKFLSIFLIDNNEPCKKYIPLCKILWVAKYKIDYGCDLMFDYDLEKTVSEEKVFENCYCSIYKYTKL